MGVDAIIILFRQSATYIVDGSMATIVGELKGALSNGLLVHQVLGPWNNVVSVGSKFPNN